MQGFKLIGLVFKKNRTRYILFYLLSLFFSVAEAQGQLPQPTGEIILKVSGNIQKSNIGKEAHFDLNMVKSMPISSITTETPWTDGPMEFEGVSLKYFLDYLGVSGIDIDAVSVDGHNVLIPIQDATDYGEDLIVGARGPLWVMYPFDDYPDTRSEIYEERAIWQVVKFNIN